jgi:hypothetical protein
MKKIYLQPSFVMVETNLNSMICGSQGVTSEKDIDYGGVDEEVTKDPASRRYRNEWEEEEGD